jgi:hypothetical protein
MDSPATLVWIAPASPDADETRALSSWARTHGVLLVAPRSEHPIAIPIDPRIGDKIEGLLEDARDALTALDGDKADRALATATEALRAHPELPQVAWLMAEVERVRSTRLRRVPPADEQASQAAWLRAQALDAGRVAGIAEEAVAGESAEATLVLDMASSGARVLLDGVPATTPAETRAGPHALVIVWDGAPIWAKWIDAPPGSSTIRVPAPDQLPCSSADFSHVGVVTDRPPAYSWVDAAATRCPHWIAAVPAPRASTNQRVRPALPEGGTSEAGAGDVLVAVCEAERCGVLLEWRAASSWTWSPPANSAARWPAWATWTLVGAGAAIAAGVVLVASGVFQAGPPGTRFVSGGLKTQ